MSKFESSNLENTMSEIEKSPFILLTKGGDERIELHKNGLNKYFLNPGEYKNVLFRGSCTCNTLNEETDNYFRQLQSELETDSEISHTLDSIKLEIKNIFKPNNQEPNFEVFLAPSGTDLVYFPLLFMSSLYPNKKILNIVTCPEELGTGTILASEGKYYSAKNQFGELLEKNQHLNISAQIEMHSLPARDKYGNIKNHEETITQLVQKSETGVAPLVNLVIGSKSGIEDNLALIPKLNNKAMFVVDMCQLRVNPELINTTINNGACVMITGSKFFQSPPFCAALLVPHKIVNDLKTLTSNIDLSPFKKIFSKYDFPLNLGVLRDNFRETPNKGLSLRWKIALNEIYRFNQLDNDLVNEVINKWNSIVSSEIDNIDCFELMKDFDLTNKTIISFRAKSSKGEYLNHEELQKLYQYLLTTKFEDIENRSIQIGQPVRYGESSFIRLAIGSVNIRYFVKHGVDAFFEKKILKLIESSIKQVFEN